jgi:polyferredoxin
MRLLEAIKQKPRASSIAYIISSFVLGALVATAQEFPIGGAAWLGATCGVPMFGAILGLIRRAFGKTSIPRWMFWWSVVALVLQNPAFHHK